MTKRSHWALATIAFALASCGLFVEPPELERTTSGASDETDDGGSTTSVPESEGGPSGGEGGGEGLRPFVDVCDSSCAGAAGQLDEPPVSDSDCVSECDCDGDGYLSVGACGGDDCDDHDPQVHPGQTDYHEEPAANPAVGFDYDCSGTAEHDPEQAVVSCGLLDLLLCVDNEGFKGSAPPCGESGEWVRCKPNALGLTCTQESLGEVVARCR